MKHWFFLLVFIVCALPVQGTPVAAMNAVDRHALRLSKRWAEHSQLPPRDAQPPDMVRLPLLETMAPLATDNRLSRPKITPSPSQPAAKPVSPPAAKPVSPPAAEPVSQPKPPPGAVVTKPLALPPIDGEREAVGSTIPYTPVLWAVVALLLVSLGGYGYVKRRRHQTQESLPDVERLFCCLHANRVPLVGRQDFVRQLDHYLADANVAVVTCIADAGVGKSALVDGWLEHLQPRFGGAHKVFAWSFQHTAIAHNCAAGGGPSSAGLFFTQALPFFGHEGALPDSEEKRGIRLSELLYAQPSLLILDGIDPLQYPANQPETTRADHMADPGLYHLLRRLCQPPANWAVNHTGSLVLLTSRRPVLGLASPTEAEKTNPYQEMVLDTLTEQESVQLLKKLGVARTYHAKLPLMVRRIHGHALALLFLSGLLNQKRSGWSNSLEAINALLAPGILGEHLQRLLQHYDEQIWPKESLHGLFLRLFGLFDRPMREKEWQAVRDNANLAEPLREMDVDGFASLINDLEQAGFLLPYTALCGWQLHPLVRDYFAQRLETECGVWEADIDDQPPAWESPLYQAHGVLFNHFCTVLDQEQPDDMAALEPLYRAVQHGCRAGRYKEALYGVYVRRIRRGSDYFSLAQFGAYGAELTALSGFFPNGWEKPPVKADLASGDRAWLLAEAAFCLTAIGRVEEALGAQKQGLLLEQARGEPKEAAWAAATLCDLQIATGNLRAALATTEQGIAWTANQQLPMILQWLLQIKQATVLHRLGKWSASLAAFQEAEAVLIPVTTESLRFLGSAKKAYIDLLLERQLLPLEGLLARTERLKEQAQSTQQPLWITLSTLSHCRVLAAMGNVDAVLAPLTTAIQMTMEREGESPLLAEMLTHRASLLRQQGATEEAWQDLTKVLEISQRWGLPLLEVDGLLLASDMYLDIQQPTEAETCLLRVETLITATEYGQRQEAAAGLRARWLTATTV